MWCLCVLSMSIRAVRLVRAAFLTSWNQIKSNRIESNRNRMKSISRHMFSVDPMHLCNSQSRAHRETRGSRRYKKRTVNQNPTKETETETEDTCLSSNNQWNHTTSKSNESFIHLLITHSFILQPSFPSYNDRIPSRLFFILCPILVSPYKYRIGK